MAEPILEVQHLKTYFTSNGVQLRASDDLSYTVHKGECVAIIGESGSGKSVSALSVMRLIPAPKGEIVGGRILFHGEDLLEKDNEEIEEIRGGKISMIFQEPSTALNPVITVGKQISEAIRLHRPDVSKKEAMNKAIELMHMVNIPNSEQRAKQYPFEFSGGMQQRAMIAMAMSSEPEILICDEPTTALDVTVQAQVLEQLDALREKYGTALIIITHNLGIVARYADNVKIMYGGKIVEEGTPEDIFENPHHPYTMGLIAAVPRLDLPRAHGLKTIEGEPPDMTKIRPDSCAFAPRCRYADEQCRICRPELKELDGVHKCACFYMEQAKREREVLFIMNGAAKELLKVEHLRMHFPVTKGLLKRQIGVVKAADDVSFTISRGETLGIVGESGSGKSTIGNCIMKNYKITDGSVVYDGIDLGSVNGRALREMRKRIQVITQDPFASLDPRMRVRDAIMEGPKIHGLVESCDRQARVEELLDLVGLNPLHADRYPHEFSGGQRQRISIARALAMNPEFIVCDEIVSALDVSIQAQIIRLMMEIQQKMNLTYMFIGHDLAVVRHISNKVAVMYLGKFMELTNSDELYEHPMHPYTQALISAAPIPNPTIDRARSRILLEGEIPSPMNPPKGCNFCTRCKYATKRCMEEEPAMTDVGNQHLVACHRIGEL